MTPNTTQPTLPTPLESLNTLYLVTRKVSLNADDHETLLKCYNILNEKLQYAEKLENVEFLKNLLATKVKDGGSLSA